MLGTAQELTATAKPVTAGARGAKAGKKCELGVRENPVPHLKAQSAGKSTAKAAEPSTAIMLVSP